MKSEKLKRVRLLTRAALFMVAALFMATGVAAARGQSPVNTNALMGVLADTNGNMAWPTDPTADSVTLTNYTSGYTNVVRLSGGATPLWMTNYGSGAGFTLSQNGTFWARDQYGCVWQTASNGVLSIVQPSGVSVIISNGTVSVASNGAPAGVVSAAVIQGSVTVSNLLTTNNILAILNAWGVTNSFSSQITNLAPWALTNAVWTNVLAPTPMFGHTLMLYTSTPPSLAGLLNTNTMALPGWTNTTASVLVSNFTAVGNAQVLSGTVALTNINISGNPYFQIFGTDAGDQNGIIGSSNNFIHALNGGGGYDDMEFWIIGGVSNAISGTELSGESLGIFGGDHDALLSNGGIAWTNDTIFGSEFSSIYNYDGQTFENSVINSYGSGISNQPGGVLTHNIIINGNGSYIGVNTVTGSGTYSNNFVEGPNAGSTWNNCVVMNAGTNAIASTTNSQFVANAPNGFYLMGTISTAAVGSTNGVGSWATNRVVFGSTGVTNTLGVNLEVFGFTGTSVVLTNFLTGMNASLGTISSAQTFVLQPGDALWGSSCAEATNRAF